MYFFDRMNSVIEITFHNDIFMIQILTRQEYLTDFINLI